DHRVRGSEHVEHLSHDEVKALGILRTDAAYTSGRVVPPFLRQQEGLRVDAEWKVLPARRDEPLVVFLRRDAWLGMRASERSFLSKSHQATPALGGLEPELDLQSR